MPVWGKVAETRPESHPAHSPSPWSSALPGLVGLRDPAASPGKVFEVSQGYIGGGVGRGLCIKHFCLKKKKWFKNSHFCDGLSYELN